MMKARTSPLMALLLAGALGSALAQVPTQAPEHKDTHDSHHASEPAPAAPAAQSAQSAPTASNEAAATDELSQGEILRWDPRTLKVTLRHGDIKNLGMPPMTMVFRVHNASLLAAFQPGDKVRFHVEQEVAGYFVTHIEVAR